MKIAVAGKGGVGKTTIAGALARFFSREGKNVLVVDADPSPNMASMLGIAREKRDAIKPLAEMSELIEERTGVKPGSSYGKMFVINPKVDDLVEKFGVTGADNVHLLVLGAIKNAGSGCFCPESALLKNLMRHLLFSENDMIILDMEAGVEHLSRGTAANVDALIIIMEPSLRSVEIGRQVQRMAAELGIKKSVGVLNKVTNETEVKKIAKELDSINLALLGAVPRDAKIAEAELTGAPIDFDSYASYEALAAIHGLLKKLHELDA